MRFQPTTALAYAASKLREDLAYPRLLVRDLNRAYYLLRHRQAYNTRGVDIFDQDWDNLVILDACRYDVFAHRADLPGELERKQSRGSMTSQFLRANFDGRDLRNTVYVTASPMLRQNRKQNKVDARLHATINIWNSDGWDDDLQTVPPAATAAAAKDAAEQYPNKRLLVHFMQPHVPFVGSDTELGETFDWGENGTGFWREWVIRDLGISDEILRQAYAENLDYVLPHVKKLLASLGGRTVVTADHGNMLGERAFPVPIHGYGHPFGVYTEELVAVPWLTVENGPRRRIVTGEGQQPDLQASDPDVTSERLRQLGYAD